jgi:hypothetical protein
MLPFSLHHHHTLAFTVQPCISNLAIAGSAAFTSRKMRFAPPTLPQPTSQKSRRMRFLGPMMQGMITTFAEKVSNPPTMLPSANSDIGCYVHVCFHPVVDLTGGCADKGIDWRGVTVHLAHPSESFCNGVPQHGTVCSISLQWSLLDDSS